MFKPMSLFLFLQTAINTTETVVPIESEIEVIQTGAEMHLLDIAFKGGWIMIVLSVLSFICVYIFF